MKRPAGGGRRGGPEHRARRPPAPAAPRLPRGPAAGPPRGPAPREDAGEHEVVYGVHAALAVFARRREDIVRIAFASEQRDVAAELLRWARASGVPASEVPPPELARLAAATHHEGLLLQTRPRRWAKPQDLAAALVERRGTAIALDRVRNPHNVGAVLRSAAFFGVDGAVLGSPAPHPALAPAAVRVAEGGAEHLLLSRTTDLADTLTRLRARGVRIVGADAQATADVATEPFTRPCLLVVGHEREGLGDRIRAQCDSIVAIRGSGHLDSLNVAVAAGILIATLTRR